MNKNKYLFLIFTLINLIVIFAPTLILYELEDKNIYYLNRVSVNIKNDENKKHNNIIIDTIYDKYYEGKYNVTTFDEYDYSVIDKIIEEEHKINNNLLKLKELENIGLLKNDFFKYIEKSNQVITRTSVITGERLNYSKKKLFISNDNYDTAFMSFEIENITKKIIALKIPKEYIIIDKNILENYINYLDLKSEDWIYKNNSITSKLKEIEIKIENINNFISITIVPYS